MLGQSRATASRPLGVELLESRINPVTVATADVYNAAGAQVLSVPVTQGVLANDFSTTQPGAVLTAQLIAGPFYVDPVGGQILPPLPASSLFLNPNGTFTFIAPPANLVPNGVTQVQFIYQATNPGNGEFGQTTVTINLQAIPTRFVAVGADAGGSPEVRVYEAGTSVLRNTFTPYESEFTGGVRVAVGDINGDGIDDIATLPQTGGSVRLRVFNGVDGNTLIDRFVFDPDFRGGGYVAIGDVNGDGTNNIIVGAGEGGGPRVTVLGFNPAAADGTQTNTLADFFAYTPEVRSGVRVAAGNLRGNSGSVLGGIRDQVLTSPGIGGGPQVNVYDGKLVGTFVAPAFSFFAGDPNNRDGIFIATGDISGTGRSDIIIGTGAGQGVVSIYDGRTGGLTRQITVPNDQTTGGSAAGGPGNPFSFVNQQNGSLISPTLTPSSLVPAPGGFIGSAGSFRGGVRVGTVDWNGDGRDDIIVGNGPGTSARVRIINSADGFEITSILPFASTFLGGINVAGSPKR